MDLLKNLFRHSKDMAINILESLLIGITVGCITALFGRVLLDITAFRTKHSLYLIPFLGIAGYIIMKMYEHWGKECINGMSLVFETGNNEKNSIPKRLIPLVIIATWITHLFGGSAGREGVAVQIGATVGYHAGSKLKNTDNNSSNILLVAGMAAGFSGLFRTPVAAVFFSLEVLTAGKMRYDSLLPAFVASYSANITSSFLGLEKFYVSLQENIDFSSVFALKLIVLGIIFGFVGRGFSISLQILKKILSKRMPCASQRAFITGIFISLTSLLCFYGRYSGLGTNLISLSFLEGVYSFDWILKFIFTVVTLAAGFQGGEVTPLFAIGAALGAALAVPLGVPTAICAALGYVAVFGSASNTLLAPLFIGAEVFGFEYLPIFFPVCVLAYISNGNKTIYSKQKILKNSEL